MNMSVPECGISDNSKLRIGRNCIMDRLSCINNKIEYDWLKQSVLTTHRLAYLSCQCDASIDVKLALVLEVTRSEQ